MTANFKDNSIGEMDALLGMQPNRPILVSEYWTGWFDNMFNSGHNVMSTESMLRNHTLAQALLRILSKLSLF